jgi:hypothetical protein
MGQERRLEILNIGGRRGRLRLWHIAALVLLTALLLLPAVACVNLNSSPKAWLSVMRMHTSGSPGVYVMGLHLPGWATMVLALSLGFGPGVVLFRSGRRNRTAKRPPFVTPPDAQPHGGAGSLTALP